MVSGTSVEEACAHDPRAQSLQPALGVREVLVGVDLAVADHHVGLAAQDRRHQLGDVAPVVLVVGVGVDDHVGAELEAGIEPRLEARGQPLVVGELDDVVHAVRSRGLDGGVGGAVVDDQPLHRVEPLDRRAAGTTSVSGSCASSLKQGIWMISFMSSGASPTVSMAPRRGRADVSMLRGGRAIHHTVAGYSYMKMDTATASTPEPPGRLAVSPPSPGRRRGAWIRARGRSPA